MQTDDSDLSVVLTYLDIITDDWADKIDQLEKNPNLKDYCVAWTELWAQYEQIDAKRKKLLAIADKINEETLPKAFEDAGIDKIYIPELARSFYPSPQYSASIEEGKLDEALNWLKQNGLGGIVKENVHRGTLAVTLKDRLLEEGKDPPPSMKLTKYTIIDSRKYTPRGK